MIELLKFWCVQSAQWKGINQCLAHCVWWSKHISSFAERWKPLEFLSAKINLVCRRFKTKIRLSQSNFCKPHQSLQKRWTFRLVFRLSVPNHKIFDLIFVLRTQDLGHKIASAINLNSNGILYKFLCLLLKD